jgi:rubrerythrin
MNQWTTTEEILDFAIQNEDLAAKFYGDLAGKSTDPAMRSSFQDMAREEIGHKKKLQAFKASGQLESSSAKILDLKISDYLVDVEISESMEYQDVLIMAMKREKAAFKLYKDMAAAARDPELKETLLGLAQEEAKHKLLFEIEYDESELRHN